MMRAERLEQFAHGSFSRVYKYRTALGAVVARKYIQSKAAFDQEVKALKTLKCDSGNCSNLIKMLENGKDGADLFIQMPLMPNTIQSLTKHREFLNEETVRAWLRGGLQGLQYIHNLKWVHRDIKSANLLVDGVILKICDFGTACAVADVAQNDFRTTAAYAPPEIYRGEKFVFASDLWGLGMSFFELLANANPLLLQIDQLAAVDGNTALRIVAPIILHRTQPIVPYSISFLSNSNLLRIVSRLLELKLERRPAAAGALAYLESPTEAERLRSETATARQSQAELRASKAYSESVEASMKTLQTAANNLTDSNIALRSEIQTKNYEMQQLQEQLQCEQSKNNTTSGRESALVALERLATRRVTKEAPELLALRRGITTTQVVNGQLKQLLRENNIALPETLLNATEYLNKMRLVIKDNRSEADRQTIVSSNAPVSSNLGSSSTSAFSTNTSGHSSTISMLTSCSMLSTTSSVRSSSSSILPTTSSVRSSTSSMHATTSSVISSTDSQRPSTTSGATSRNTALSSSNLVHGVEKVNVCQALQFAQLEAGEVPESAHPEGSSPVNVAPNLNLVLSNADASNDASDSNSRSVASSTSGQRIEKSAAHDFSALVDDLAMSEDDTSDENRPEPQTFPNFDCSSTTAHSASMRAYESHAAQQTRKPQSPLPNFDCSSTTAHSASMRAYESHAAQQKRKPLSPIKNAECSSHNPLKSQSAATLEVQFLTSERDRTWLDTGDFVQPKSHKRSMLPSSAVDSIHNENSGQKAVPSKRPSVADFQSENSSAISCSSAKKSHHKNRSPSCGSESSSISVRSSASQRSIQPRDPSANDGPPDATTSAKLMRFASRNSLTARDVDDSLAYARWRSAATSEQPTEELLLSFRSRFPLLQVGNKLTWTGLEQLALLSLFAFVNKNKSRATMLFARDKRRRPEGVRDKMHTLSDELN